jgi:acetyl esterase
MPLDADMQAVLDALVATGGPPMEDVPVAESRLGDWSAPFAGPPEPVGSVGNRFVPGPTADLPVRIYTPQGKGPFPALVFFHGSAWCVANIDVADVPHRAIANRTGAVVVAVNYQKAPEHKFPVPFDDAYAAAAWVVENATSLDVDPGAVGVGGDSAGGNLAAAVCLRARDEDGPKLAFQLLVYPAVDARMEHPSITEHSDTGLLTTSTLRWAWEQYLRDERDGENPFASPLRAADLAGLPPAIVLTAEFDPLRDEAEAYGARLLEAGVPTVVRRYDGMTHGFLWTPGAVAGSRRLLDDIGRDVKDVVGATVPS